MYQRDGCENPDILSTWLRIRRPGSECYVDFGSIFAGMSVGGGQMGAAISDAWACVYCFARACACVLCRQYPANKRWAAIEQR